MPLLTICRTFLGWMILWESVVGWRWGLRGSGPALAGKLGENELWRFAPEVEVVRFQCSLRPVPAAASRGVGPSQLHKRGHSVLFGYHCNRTGDGLSGSDSVREWEEPVARVDASWGSAGEVLRSQGSSGRMRFGALRQRWRLFASNARSGPLPLPRLAGVTSFERQRDSLEGVGLKDRGWRSLF